ncbi:MAG: cyclase family protein [Chloroflexota bacterium]
MAQRIIDLSLSFRNGMRGVTLEQNSTIATKGFNTTNLHLYSHAGTHMDAPLHFLDKARTIDQIVLEKCIGPAQLIDLTHKAPNSLILVEDVAPYADKITAGSRLLLRTDWSQQAEQEDYYRANMPRVSPELAHWLVEKEIVLLGLETPSVASLRPENRAELAEVHQILLKAEIVIVESLANLSHLTQDVVHFIALPLKIDSCDGSPIRAVALETT